MRERHAAFRVLPVLGLVGLLAGPPQRLAGQERVTGVIPELAPAECMEGDDRIPVLLVGSYHMSNPGADQFNLEADDVLLPERQKEIAAVVEGLTAFEPTVVAIESPWGDTVSAMRYTAFLDGEHDLSRQEEEQIGFRLAAAAGLETVHGIDVRIGLPNDRLASVLEARPELGRYMGGLQEYGEWAMATMAKWLSEGTVGEMLYRMNTPEAIEWADRGYLEFFLPLAAGDDYGGAEFVATWYERNLKIFSNLHRISAPGDRVFVIYGAGHVPHLRYFVALSPYYCVEDPLPYLPKPD
ncbi:MAG: DUF5694 domain-containing protein [marine benthic group bacterium]|nr:DUF5694 domain-containing protein [Candidatus Benthicola marisminoris]